MKKLFWTAVLLSVFLTGCTKETEPYRYTDYTLFDTVTTVVGYGESRQAFRQEAEKMCLELQTYHRLFDQYHLYDGIQNLKIINDQAGVGPVEIPEPLMELLTDSRYYYERTGRRVNIGMGSVLSLWHEARDQALQDPRAAGIPSMTARQQAQKHCDLSNLILDSQKGTAFLQDPHMRLDVGAVAKGWAVQKVSESAPEGMLLSAGGNVCATGPKPDGSPWIVGIQDPEGDGYICMAELSKGCLVTSGDYQRYFEVDGKKYHHIIDPDTAMPGEYWRSVTVYCTDSGLADALSTALFLLPLDQGQELLNNLGAEALWLNDRGEIFHSPGFPLMES